MSSIPADAPAPRLCHIIKRPDFDGFGFNLFAGKARPGQFIGKVDAGSPAEAAGLFPGDRIVEVNGINVSNENHKQVVQRIKLRPDETELLVVNDEADEYYSTRGIVIKSSMPNVVRKRSQPPIAVPEPRKISSSSDESDDDQPVHKQQQHQQQTATPVANGIRRVSNSSNSSVEDLSRAPAPRLCHVVKWSASDGFGFHLLADKKRKGQFIGKVDVGSAAEAAGLKPGDRIVEVNGHNVLNESHKEVVQRIKSVPNETQLLVVDPQGQLYYAERNVAISSSMPNVVLMKTPARPAPNQQTANNKPAPVKVTPEPDTLATSKLRSSLKDVSSAPAPRLCHIVKWRQDSGYGFHLLADKKRTGHYIGKVDAGTPAEAGGLKVNDRIIEVNGANVVNESHAQIVERIKSVPNETRLLVLDPEADAYYEQRNILVTSAQSNVIYMKTPPLRPVSASYSSDDENDNRVQMRRRANRSQTPDSRMSTPRTPTSPTRPISRSTIMAAEASGLDLNMSAAQLRARLADRRKYDPKRESMDLRRKHEIIQTM